MKEEIVEVNLRIKLKYIQAPENIWKYEALYRLMQTFEHFQHIYQNYAFRVEDFQIDSDQTKLGVMDLCDDRGKPVTV